MTSKQTSAERISFKEVIELVHEQEQIPYLESDMILNSEAIWIIESILNDVLNFLIQEVQKSQATQTTQTNDMMKLINDAVLKIFRGTIGKDAISKGNEAIEKFKTSSNCGLTFNYQIIDNYLRQKNFY